MTTPKNEYNGKPIRAQFSAETGEWVFSVIDVIAALVNPAIPRNYWSDLKRTLKQEGSQLHEKIVQLKMISPADGKPYKTDCLNKEGLLAIARRIKKTQSYEDFEAWLSGFDGSNRKYILKHKDVDVLEIELDDNGAISAIGRKINAAHLPVGTEIVSGINFQGLREWWSSRCIPASREGIKDFLRERSLYLPQQLLEKSFGLSLSDQYWICPQNQSLSWTEINFFHNSFSDDAGDLLFGRSELKDGQAVSLFSPDNTSDGVLKKKWKIIDGKRCLIKGGTLPINQEVANEVLASRICKRLGIPFVDYRTIDIDGVKYSICEDFITGDTELVPAWRIKSLIQKDNSTSDYEAWVTKAKELGLTDARLRIDMMLTLDYIIVNVDRHYNNFGIVRNANTLEWLSVAPIFDSGNSMWCKEQIIDPTEIKSEAKPFKKKMDRQIKFVKDFSWLNLAALDGIEDEYAQILNEISGSAFEIRNKKLCEALRKRIEMLREIVAAAIFVPQ